MPNLALELNIAPGEMVGLVGAGGKTTTVTRLVYELLALGRNVVSTSTVHMMSLRAAAPHPFLVEPDAARLLAELPALLAENRHVRISGETPRADKVRGLDAATVDLLKGAPGVDNLLVECDGARHRMLKAPADHEPVIPQLLDLLLIVAGLDAIGMPLDDDHVHRVEQVSALTGLQPGDPITPAAIATIVTSPAGGLKSKPPAARAWAILTKYGSDKASAGEALADEILSRDSGLAGVILLGPAPGGRWEDAQMRVKRSSSSPSPR